MIKRILVPIDFSKCSINALRYAALLAKKIKVEELQIMHAFTSPVAYSEVGAYYSMNDMTHQVENELNQKFNLIKYQVPELDEIPFEFIKIHAFVIDATLSVCMTSNIDLIVMGTKGASGINEIVFGTNTYDVIKDSKCPVLVIPEEAEFRHIKNVVFASDYKPIDSKILEPLKLFNKVFGTHIHIVHVSQPRKLTEKERDEAKKYEEYFSDIPHLYHYLENNNIEEGLNDYVESNDIDALALVPRKHKFYDIIYGGGESKPIIFHTKLPLLALPV